MRQTELIPNLDLFDYNPVTFGFEPCKAGHNYGPAVRSYWLLHFVLSGKGIFEYQGKKHQLNKGDIFVIPPYEETYYEADKTDPWYYIWIGFTTKREIPAFFRSPVLHCPEAEHVFEEMKICCHKKTGKAEFLVAKLWELVSILSQETETPRSYVEQALQYMKSEYMNSMSISTLAQRLGIDRSYLSNIFKEQIGTSPAKYLSDIRLSNAAELLIKHGMSPTTAAFSCGFSDIYHFSKAFKKKFGLSPRAYKDQHVKRPR